jgi:hypothetical protein
MQAALEAALPAQLVGTLREQLDRLPKLVIDLAEEKKKSIRLKDSNIDLNKKVDKLESKLSDFERREKEISNIEAERVAMAHEREIHALSLQHANASKDLAVELFKVPYANRVFRESTLKNHVVENSAYPHSTFDQQGQEHITPIPGGTEVVPSTDERTVTEG